jgi:crotonobetainyl-CoA:carnitine CoA-transferase CaiB-like acyl-CoA transferase
MIDYRAHAAAMNAGPLSGIVVLDLTLALAGPLCTQRLGDMGAEIIKIEGPARRDFTRTSPMRDQYLGGETTTYLSINRNKRSLALDLKSPDGQAIFARLVRDADVVIQNFRPGVAERLGVSFERLQAINPRIVYVSITGYGDSGPMIDRPGQDLLVQSFSGTTFNAGTADGLPHPSPIYVVDVAASHQACEAVLAGIIQRDRQGVAVEAKVSLLAAVLEIQIQEVTTHLTTGKAAPRGSAPYASTWMEPPYGIYPMRDGFMAIAQSSLRSIAEVLESPDLEALAEARPDPADDEALLGWRDAVYPLVARLLKDRAVEPTVAALHAAGVWCGPVQDYAGLARHPQAAGLFADIEHPTAGPIRTLAPAIRFSTQPEPRLAPAPRLGEHSAAILARVGVDAAEFERLQQQGVVA